MRSTHEDVLKCCFTGFYSGSTSFVASGAQPAISHSYMDIATPLRGLACTGEKASPKSRQYGLAKHCYRLTMSVAVPCWTTLSWLIDVGSLGCVGEMRSVLVVTFGWAVVFWSAPSGRGWQECCTQHENLAKLFGFCLHVTLLQLHLLLLLYCCIQCSKQAMIACELTYCIEPAWQASTL